MQLLIFLLKSSRPGLWFCTIWLYLLPTSQMDSIWSSFPFWFGLFYVSFPLNLLVYGWNDYVDVSADKLNPRKDSFLFGARGTEEEVRSLPKAIITTQLLCLPYLVYLSSAYFLLLFTAFLVISWLYNLPNGGLRSKPPLELLCQIGYLLVVPISILLNDTSQLPIWSYAYLLLFAWQSHLIGEVMDIEPDAKAGKTTTAVLIGMRKTKLLIILFVALEIGILAVVIQDYFFAGFLGLGLVWLMIDLFIVYKTKIYSLAEMKLFGYLSNLMAIISMSYVWLSGCLLS